MCNSPERYSINTFTEPLNYSGLYLNIGTLKVFFISGTIWVKKTQSEVKYSGFEYEKNL